MPAACDDSDFELFKRKVLRDRGFDCGKYRSNYLERRVSMRMRAHEVTSYKDYMRILDKDPQEYNKFFDALAINVTQFFRNPETFECFEKRVIPQLILEKERRNSKIIRIWSAGCASGEEPYSIAILMHEALAGKDWLVSIYGTDIDEEALACAREGGYKPAQLRGVRNDIIDGYFIRNGNYVLRDDVKRRVKFFRHDLLVEKGYAYLDVIFCRNLVIYFSKKTQEGVFMNFYNCLNNGGYFILGKTETLTPNVLDKFECVDGAERIYRKPLRL